MERYSTSKLTIQIISISFITGCSPNASTSCSWRNPINKTEASNIALEEFKGTSRFFGQNNNKTYGNLWCPKNCRIEVTTPTSIDRFFGKNDKENHYVVSIVMSSSVIDKIDVSSCGIANKEQ